MLFEFLAYWLVHDGDPSRGEGLMRPEKKRNQKSKDGASWRDSDYHRLLGLKASQEVKRLLSFFEKELPHDDRPRRAVEAVAAWALGKRKLSMAEVRKLSLASHAAARAAQTDTARFVARAAGHAVATWHVPTHALGAFGYAGRVRGIIAVRGRGI